MFMNRYPFKKKAPNTNLQAPVKISSKLQTPRSREAPNIKHQPVRDTGSFDAIGVWNLDLPWSLDLGPWSFLRRLATSKALIILGCLLAPPPSTHAFCGFYVAKADTKLFNKAS